MGREGRTARHVLWSWWPPWGSTQRGPAEEQHRGHLRTVHRASQQRAYIHQYQSCGSRVTLAGLTHPHFQTIMLEPRYKQEGTHCGEQLSQPARSCCHGNGWVKGGPEAWEKRHERSRTHSHSTNTYCLLCAKPCVKHWRQSSKSQQETDSKQFGNWYSILSSKVLWRQIKQGRRTVRLSARRGFLWTIRERLWEADIRQRVNGVRNWATCIWRARTFQAEAA